MAEPTPPLIALAERVEKAIGPDRELDAETHTATGQVARLVSGDLPPVCTHDYEQQVGYWVKRYTSSLDAAMSLVPEGMRWKCGFTKHVPHVAEVWLGDGRGYVDGNSDHSRPLALTAASLRALAQVQS
jgi:hypothetical protein